MTDVDDLKAAIEGASPPLWAALSPLGREVAFPKDIPFQAAEARGAMLNGTIGQVTDGQGRALVLPSVAGAIALPPEVTNRAMLYSPVEGRPEVRNEWRRWQRRGIDDAVPSTRPLVTVGLTHGLSIAADLFAGPGRAVAVPAPFWGNYRQTFAVRTGAKMVTADVFKEGAYNPTAIPEALAEEPDGEPAVAIVNLPSNPGGYMPTAVERARLVSALAGEAVRRPLVVLCDDAYAGLVYEPDIPARSIFWDLVGVHPQLVPVKIDGATKEFSLFGARVGFLTFPFAPESAVANAMESKVKCLVRATVGSPVATSQVLLQQALLAEDVEAQVETIRRELAGRYRVLAEALAAVDSRQIRPLPFNAGCFALLELAEGLDPETVRRHLLAEHDTGLIAVRPSYLRIAFCSVRAEDLPDLVAAVVRGVEEIAGTR